MAGGRGKHRRFLFHRAISVSNHEVVGVGVEHPCTVHGKLMACRCCDAQVGLSNISWIKLALNML